MNESQPSSDRDRIAADPLVAWILAAEDDQEFVRRVFRNFGDRLDELECRIMGVLEDGPLDAGRRQALFERIAVSGGLLMEFADAIATDRGRCEG